MSCPAANIEVDNAVTIPQAISIFVLFFICCHILSDKGYHKINSQSRVSVKVYHQIAKKIIKKALKNPAVTRKENRERKKKEEKERKEPKERIKKKEEIERQKKRVRGLYSRPPAPALFSRAERLIREKRQV